MKPSESDINLLTCPFCDRSAISENHDDNGWYVACGNDACHFKPSDWFDNEPAAVQAWNTRAAKVKHKRKGENMDKVLAKHLATYRDEINVEISVLATATNANREAATALLHEVYRLKGMLGLLIAYEIKTMPFLCSHVHQDMQERAARRASLRREVADGNERLKLLCSLRDSIKKSLI